MPDSYPNISPPTTSTQKSHFRGFPTNTAKVAARLDMETYNGHVRTPTDAIILFEACRLGLLPRVQRRLSEKERQLIRSGSVFVWDEREAGMRRWTDGKSWSASRVSGSFLTYREMEGKRGGNTVAVTPTTNGRTPESARNSADDSAQTQQGDAEDGPDGYRYKADGLMKQSFSITTSEGHHLHLISYYARSHPTAPGLRQPTNDPSLSHIHPAKGMYPETTVNDQSNLPAVTQSPMPGAPGYAMAPASPFPRPGATHPQGYLVPGYGPYLTYAPGPPPPGYAPIQAYPYTPVNGSLPPPGYPAPPHGYPHHAPLSQPPPGYDQRPIHSADSSRAPPPPPLAPNRLANSPMPYPTGQTPLPPYQPPTYPRPPLSGKSESPTQATTSTTQIDPRLSGSSAQQQPEQANGNGADREALASPKRSNENGIAPVTASQAPTIGALVNGDLPSSTQNGNKENVSDHNEKVSPGETKKSGVHPQMQDIPSEKLGFREDSRALRQLDKVFARV